MKKTYNTTKAAEPYCAPCVETVATAAAEIICSSLEEPGRNEDSENWFNN